MADPRPLKNLTYTLADGRGALPHTDLHLSTNFGLSLTLGYSDEVDYPGEPTGWHAYVQSPCCQSDIRMSRPTRKPVRGGPVRYCSKCRERVNHSSRGFDLNEPVPQAALEALTVDHLNPLTAVMAVDAIMHLLEWLATLNPHLSIIDRVADKPLETIHHG